MLEPCAVKMASTVLRRGLHREMVFLSDNNGSIRESYFVSQIGLLHQVHFFDKGDFIVDGKLVFEIGRGASKTDKQLQNNDCRYVVADNIEIGFDNKIPLRLFGFLY